MIIKLINLIEAQAAITVLRQSRDKLNHYVSLRLARFWRQIEPELNDYRAAEILLFQEKGELSKDGKQYLPPQNQIDRQKFFEALAALQAEEVELMIRPFSFEELAPAGISADDILALDQCGVLSVDWENIEKDDDTEE